MRASGYAVSLRSPRWSTSCTRKWPTRLELRGGYHALLSFFARLASCAPDIVVEDIELRAVDEADAGAAVAAACTITAIGFHGETGASDARAADAGCPPDATGGVAAAGAAPAPADPFAPFAPAADGPAVAARAPGLPGLRIDELTLQGLVHAGGAPLAVVAAPDGGTYLLRGGERLLDGAVAAVQADAVVFREDGAAARETRRTLADEDDGR